MQLARLLRAEPGSLRDGEPHSRAGDYCFERSIVLKLEKAAILTCSTCGVEGARTALSFGAAGSQSVRQLWKDPSLLGTYLHRVRSRHGGTHLASSRQANRRSDKDPYEGRRMALQGRSQAVPSAHGDESGGDPRKKSALVEIQALYVEARITSFGARINAS